MDKYNENDMDCCSLKNAIVYSKPLLSLLSAKPLFTLSMLKIPCDAEMWQCTARYCWKLPTSFNVLLFCINRGDRATLVGKEVRKKGDLNEICACISD